MMKSTHPVTDAALDADIAIVAKKGRGKSYTARGLVERLLEQGRQVVVLDPLSTWWGLKAAGAGPGFPIPVIGGPQGDVPLDPERLADQARALAAHLVASKSSVVIDLGALRKGALVRFAEVLLDELYTTNRTPLWLVLEEADVLAPQQPMPDTARVLGEVDRIARRGRQFGFRLITITQRPAKIAKDVLTQLSTLIALGLTSPQDRGAVEGWVAGVLEKKAAVEFAGSLAGLAVGEGFIWTPDRMSLERVHFPKIRTLDTSATPAAGAAAPKAKPVKVDVAALQEALSARAFADAKPITAKAKPSQAEERPASAAELAAAEERGFRKGVNAGVRVGWTNAHTDFLRHMAGHAGKFPTLPSLAHIDAMIEVASEGGAASWATREKPASAPLAPPKPKRPAVEPPRERKALSPDLTPALQRVLDALGWWRAAGHAAVPRARASVVAGYSPKASTFGVYIGDLIKRGLVVSGSGTVGLTDAGIAVADVPGHVTPQDLRASAHALLKPQEARVFDVVYEAAGAPIRRDDVARAVGLSPTASTAGVYIGAVAAYGFIETAGRGEIRAAPWLFTS